MAALRRTRPLASSSSESLPLAVRVLARAVAPLRASFGDLLEFLLPQRCPGCGVAVDPARFLCERCLARLPKMDAAVCARCLRDEQPPDSCARHPGDRVYAAWVYDERVALLVHALKFAARPKLAGAHVAVLARALPDKASHPDLVTSVPLHATRLRERGYDQAACLGEALAEAIGAPFVPGILRRVRATRAQSGLSPGERRRNVRGAFRVARPAWVRGRRVLVVDDVLTTGSTLSECLGLLREHGARTSGAVLAWAP